MVGPDGDRRVSAEQVDRRDGVLQAGRPLTGPPQQDAELPLGPGLQVPLAALERPLADDPHLRRAVLDPSAAGVGDRAHQLDPLDVDGVGVRAHLLQPGSGRGSDLLEPFADPQLEPHHPVVVGGGRALAGHGAGGAGAVPIGGALHDQHLPLHTSTSRPIAPASATAPASSDAASGRLRRAGRSNRTGRAHATLHELALPLALFRVGVTYSIRAAGQRGRPAVRHDARAPAAVVSGLIRHRGRREGEARSNPHAAGFGAVGLADRFAAD